MVSRMNGVTEWYCTPYEVTEEEFVKAILDTDEYSKSRQSENKVKALRLLSSKL